MKKVFLTQEIHPDALKLMQGKVEIMVSPSPDDEVIRSQVSGCHGLVVRSATRLSRETIFAADSLEVIARTGAGVDNVDIGAATERGIPVCHTPEANKISVAEHTFALMLALAKGLLYLDREVRQGSWKVRDSQQAFDLKGKSIGLVGLGRIGREVARLAISFGMTVLAYDPFVSCPPKRMEVEIVQTLQEIFKQADIISIHVPLTDKTRNLISASLLNLLKPASILINTSRGAIINELALVGALSKGELAGAGLDVFSSEPLSKDNPLCQLPNVILTPHFAAFTRECRLKMACDAIRGLLDVLEGRRPRWVANRGALNHREPDRVPIDLGGYRSDINKSESPSLSRD